MSLIEAAKAALEALEHDYFSWQPAAKNLRTAIEEAEKAEPVAITTSGPGNTHPAPIPEGWLRAIDEWLVIIHQGVAEASDSYETAREKLHRGIYFEIQVATDPAVNGGWKMVPNEPTLEYKP